jgi:hypothetical protein
MAIEIVDWAMLRMMIFYGYVSLPQGNHHLSSTTHEISAQMIIMDITWERFFVGKSEFHQEFS